MKNILLVVYFCWSVPAMATVPDISKLRTLLHRASSEEVAADEMMIVLRDVEERDGALLLGYKGMAFIMLAKHSLNPFDKLKYFLKGKRYLEDAIAKDKGNIELRFLRFAVQSKAPFFLQYSGKVNEDKKILLNGIPGVKDKTLRENIVIYILENGKCSDAERIQLRMLLN